METKKNIEINGAEILNDAEKETINKITSGAYDKLKRSVKNNFILKVVLKEYSRDKENLVKRRKFSVHAEISGFSRIFEADDFGWELNKVFHSVFQKLNKELEHEFHVSEQGKR